jgi:rod shape determining protein RodA
LNRAKAFDNIDWVMVLLYYLLVIFGWVNIYAADHAEGHIFNFSLSQSYMKQAMFIGLCTILGFSILMIDPKVFSALSFVIYGASLALLIGVLLFGKEIQGARSWFHIGDFALQPSEFAKFATSLALASYLSRIELDLTSLKTIIYTGIIILLPAGLIVLQNDAGSALVYTSFVFVLYREGLTGNIFVVALAVATLFIGTLVFGQLLVLGVIGGIALLLIILVRKKWKSIMTVVAVLLVSASFVYSVDYGFNNILEPHQQVRINVLFGIESDPSGAEYNVNQSKIAIGSGGVSGKGFLQGTQTKFKMVPEQSTDFIFSTVGEEWGYLGTAGVIVTFLLLFLRIIQQAEKQRSRFSRIYGYSVASILFFHFSVNIAMTIGLAPVIGIPLPFFSYGGSSLIGFTILLFIFIKQSSKKYDLI